MILAIDIGTSTVKGVLFSESGACEAQLALPVTMRVDEDPAIHEVSAEDWLEALKAIASRLLAGRGAPEAVTISGNGPTLVPVGADGRPLPVIRTLRELADETQWSEPGVVQWLCAPTTYFDGLRPVDLLAGEPVRVVDAARQAWTVQW